MTQRNIQEFTKQFPFGGVRVNNNGTSFMKSDDYQLSRSSFKKGTFVCMKSNHVPLMISDFAIQVSGQNNRGPALYELDVVSYIAEGSPESVGSICYDASRYMWVVKDFDSKKSFPLYMCKINKVLGSLLTDPSLLHADEACPAPSAINAAERPALESVNSDEDFAMLMEPVPGLENIPLEEIIKQPSGSPAKSQDKKSSGVHVYAASVKYSNGQRGWQYIFESNGRHKKDNAIFRSNNEEQQFYFFASVVIALDALRDPKSVILHCPYKTICDLINDGSLASMDIAKWTYKNGTVPSANTRQTMMELQELLQTKAANIKAVHTPAAEIAAKAQSYAA